MMKAGPLVGGVVLLRRLVGLTVHDALCKLKSPQHEKIASRNDTRKYLSARQDSARPLVASGFLVAVQLLVVGLARVTVHMEKTRRLAADGKL